MLKLGFLRERGYVLAGSGSIEDAVTEVLRASRIDAHPAGIWKIGESLYGQLISRIVERGYPVAQAVAALNRRGYVSSAPPPGMEPRTPVVQPVITQPSIPVPSDTATTRFRIWKPPGRAPLPDKSFNTGTRSGVPAGTMFIARRYVAPTPVPSRQIFTVIEPERPATVLTKQVTTLPTAASDMRAPHPEYAPVIIPGLPDLRTAHPAIAEQKAAIPWFWLALAGVFLVGFSRPKRGRRKKKRTSLSGVSVSPADLNAGMGDLSGPLLSCDSWEEEEKEEGGFRWVCRGYAPTAGNAKCASMPTGSDLMKTCVEYKMITPSSERYKGKQISRCARYTQLCPQPPSIAIKRPAEKPEAHPAHYVDVQKQTKEYAKHLAKEKNEKEEARKNALAREITSRGGIRSYRKGVEKEEYREIPIFMRRNAGLPLDEMASEMGMDEGELMARIRQQYPGGKGKKRRLHWTDFEREARESIYAIYEQGAEELDEEREKRERMEAAKAAFFADDDLEGLGQRDLFPELRRELVLEIEDTATSDDPLIAYLERKGWKRTRIEELQESIAAKAVPDIFTGKMEKLTRAERELQKAIQGWLDKRSGTPEGTRPICRRDEAYTYEKQGREEARPEQALLDQYTAHVLSDRSGTARAF